MIYNPLFRVIVLLVMSWFFKIILPTKVRNFLTPWCFALSLIHQNIVPFIAGFPHFALMALYWVEIAILLNGCKLSSLRHNSVMKAFLVFWGYLTLSAMLCDYPRYGVLYYMNALLELVLVGYYVGIWAITTEDGLVRLFRAVVIIAIIPIMFYVRYGAGGELDSAGRIVLDQDIVEEGLGQNVNGIALALAPIIVCLLIFVTFDSTVKKTHPVLKMWAIIMLMASSFFLLRTGSRNGTLVLVPCAYFIYKKLATSRQKNSFLVFLILIGALAVGWIVSSQAGGIRALSLTFESSGAADLDSFSSGRVSIFRNLLSRMNGLDYFLGKGPLVVRNDNEYAVLGAMSIYVTVYHNTGVIGCSLLLIYFSMMFYTTRRIGNIGLIAFLFFAAWAITGVAEDSGLGRGHSIRMIQGVSLALCSKLLSQRRNQMRYTTSVFQPMEYYRSF